MLTILSCCPGPTTLCCKSLLFGDDAERTEKVTLGRSESNDADVIWRPKVIFQDGRTYEGQWKGKLRHGQGKELSRYNDFVYEGSFRNDQYHGYGNMSWSNGARYSGQFHLNEKHGYGEETYSNGERFEGCFINGRVHGRGHYFFKDNTSLKGDWEHGKLVNELSTFSDLRSLTDAAQSS